MSDTGSVYELNQVLEPGTAPSLSLMPGLELEGPALPPPACSVSGLGPRGPAPTRLSFMVPVPSPPSSAHWDWTLRRAWEVSTGQKIWQ